MRSACSTMIRALALRVLAPSTSPSGSCCARPATTLSGVPSSCAMPDAELADRRRADRRGAAAPGRDRAAVAAAALEAASRSHIAFISRASSPSRRAARARGGRSGRRRRRGAPSRRAAHGTADEPDAERGRDEGAHDGGEPGSRRCSRRARRANSTIGTRVCESSIARSPTPGELDRHVGVERLDAVRVAPLAGDLDRPREVGELARRDLGASPLPVGASSATSRSRMSSAFSSAFTSMRMAASRPCVSRTSRRRGRRARPRGSGRRVAARPRGARSRAGC